MAEDRFKVKTGVLVDTRGKGRWLPIGDAGAEQLQGLADEMNANAGRADHFVWSEGAPPKS